MPYRASGRIRAIGWSSAFPRKRRSIAPGQLDIVDAIAAVLQTTGLPWPVTNARWHPGLTVVPGRRRA